MFIPEKLLNKVSGSANIYSVRKMDKEEIIKLLRENMETMRKAYGVKRIGIFGSAVRNELTSNSDIDIVVEFEPDRISFKTYGGLAIFLEKLLGREIDLVTPDEINNIKIKSVKREIKKETEYV
jgi:predicted nucleotidyltransferase